VTSPDQSAGRRNGRGLRRVGLGGGIGCFLSAFLVLVALAALPASAAERRVALVIGNGSYAQTPLPNTINDARAMTDVLGRLGFKVITKLNATQREMLYAIVDFGHELEKGGVGLFYYAGHAVQIRGQNFMIPIGARITVEDHVEPESVDLNKVVGRMAGARNKLNILILDSCRDNPFGNTFNFYSEGLAQTRAPAGTYIAYAAAPGELAADGTGTNSFYTGALVKTLGIQGIPIEETFKRVRASVLKETKGLQVPWTSSSITGDFYFNPLPPKVAEKKGAATAKAVDRELVFWQSIYNSSRPEDFEAYLSQFPKGNFATLASNRLTELRRAKPATASEPTAAVASKASDPALLNVIDRAIADARGGGADYAKQIQAAVEALNAMRRQREEVERDAEEARKQVAAAVRQKADKSFEEDLAKAKQAAADAEKATLAAATGKAEHDRKGLLEAAERRAREQAAAALETAQRQADKRAASTLAEAEKKAAAQRKQALALANDQAADAYRKAIADAERAAEVMRQRMIEVSRTNADKRLQDALSDAKQEADTKAAAIVAAAKSDAEDRKGRDLAAIEKQVKASEAKLVEAAQKEAARKYEAAIAEAEKAAKAEADRILADAQRAAEERRQKQLASLAPKKPAPKGSEAASPSDAALGLGGNVPPELRRRIDAAMAEARKKGQDHAGEMRAALGAIKAYRKTETAAKPAAPSPIDISAATPELKEIIEIAMKKARAEGKNYQGQVQAALNAVKVYRDRENKDEKSAEADNSQTSALLLGQSQTDPELRRVINTAMAQARARGETYAEQVHAALDAIKAHRARTAGTGGR
jgi:uncharacterized caspase-like protein